MDSLSNITYASTSQNTIKTYWQTAINDSCPAGPFDSWFCTLTPPASLFEVPSTTTKRPWPTLKHNDKNDILLYPGSFNPPHQGDLATILYFYKHRKEFGIVAMFVFPDPVDQTHGKNKKYDEIVLPQELRSRLFAEQSKLSKLFEEGWLQLLLGTREGITKALISMTGLIRAAGFDASLTGLLDRDELSRAELGTWGPIDGFLTLNARWPIDFYNPEPPKGKPSVPINLRGCTEWKRGPEYDGIVSEGALEESIGELWVCKALTVKGTPTIRFYATQSSASNGVSPLRISMIISGAVRAGGGKIPELLKDQVLSVEILDEWLEDYRRQGSAQSSQV